MKSNTLLRSIYNEIKVFIIKYRANFLQFTSEMSTYLSFSGDWQSSTIILDSD